MMSDNSFQLFLKAESLTEIERWQEAIPLLLQYLAKNPQDYNAMCLLSLCYFNLDKTDSALDYANKAVAIEPEEEWAHRLRSIILGKLGKKKESFQAAEEAVRLAPNQVYPLHTLVMAYLDSNKVRQAKEIAETLRENNPYSDETFLALGSVYLQMNNPYQAEQCFREALRINPNNPNARNNLGTAILSQERLKPTTLTSNPNPLFGNAVTSEIAEHFTEAIKLEPNNEYVLANIKRQFSYSPFVLSALALLPMLLMFFVVSPGLAVVVTFLGLLSYSNLLWETFKRRRNVTPEIKILLKRSKKTFSAFVNEFKTMFDLFVLKCWQPHLLALMAVIFRLVIPSGNTGILYLFSGLPTVLIIVSCIWLAAKITRS